VVAELYTDKPPHGERNSEVLTKRFDFDGLPLYVILGPDGKERGRKDSRLSADSFMAFLRQGAQKP
jgi:hypothetical protein